MHRRSTASIIRATATKAPAPTPNAISASSLLESIDGPSEEGVGERVGDCESEAVDGPMDGDWTSTDGHGITRIPLPDPEPESDPDPEPEPNPDPEPEPDSAEPDADPATGFERGIVGPDSTLLLFWQSTGCARESAIIATTVLVIAVECVFPQDTAIMMCFL